jgi:hypothetical protein
MNYTLLKNLKLSIDTFDDASFVSLLNEETAIVQNNKNKSLWSLPFSVLEDNTFVFHPVNGELLEDGEAEIEEYQESLSEINKNILVALRESDDSSYRESLGDLLKFFDPSKIKKEIQNEDPLFEGTHYELLSEEEQSWMKSFQNRWSEKMNKIRASFLDFQSSGSLFEGNQIKSIDEMYDPLFLLNLYQESLIVKEFEMENVHLFSEWSSRVDEILSAEVLEGINPLSESWKTDLLKNLVHYKKDKDSSIAIHEIAKQISEIHEEIFAECEMPLSSDVSTPVGGGYDGENKLHFLKMSGMFTNEDLKNLIKDFDYVLGSGIAKDEDELRAISALKDKVEYMYRTNAIDDETVSSTINSFNTKYGRDGRDVYRNPDASSGTVIVQRLSPEMSQPIGV